MAHDVFISHSSKDKNIADAVCSILEQNKIRCWIAPRDVIPGKNYAACITEAITQSKFLVIIFSSNSNVSGAVTNELELALRHNVIIIPLRIEDVEPSHELEYYLSSRHWLDALSAPIENHILKLAETIKNFELNENTAPQNSKKNASEGNNQSIKLGTDLYSVPSVSEKPTKSDRSNKSVKKPWVKYCMVAVIFILAVIIVIVVSNQPAALKAFNSAAASNVVQVTESSAPSKSSAAVMSTPAESVTQQSIYIDFDDKNLEAELRKQFNIPSNKISIYNVSSVKELKLSSCKISSIKALSYFKNLETLDLGVNEISDISPLKDLVYLEKLNLAFNPISDISPLAAHPLLTDLNLEGDRQINDISSMDGLKQLQYLNISGNKISNISVIENMIGLKELYLAENSISDIKSISGLTNLQKLTIGNNKISDISVLTLLKKLNFINVDPNPIIDYSPLKSLPKTCQIYNP